MVTRAREPVVADLSLDPDTAELILEALTNARGNPRNSVDVVAHDESNTHFANRFRHIGSSEESSPRDHDVGPVRSGDADRTLIDPPVDLNVIREAVTLPIIPRLRHLGHRLIFHESLTPEARHHGHDEEQVDLIEMGHNRLEWCRRIQSEAAAEPRSAGPGKRFADIVIGLDVDGDAISACCDESIEILVGTRHHKMHIEGDPGVGTNRGNKLGAKGDIFDEMTVHDVEMEPVRPGLFSFFHLLA
jgi:hypothetical protein